MQGLSLTADFLITMTFSAGIFTLKSSMLPGLNHSYTIGFQQCLLFETWASTDRCLCAFPRQNSPLRCSLLAFPLRCSLLAFPLRCSLLAFPLRCSLLAFPLRCSLLAFPLRCSLLAFPLRCSLLAFPLRCSLLAFPLQLHKQ